MIAPGREGVYDPTSGFVIHGQGVANAPGLFAMPFSLATLSATGESFKISDRGYSASVSQEGTLVFTAQSGEATGKIVVRDRSGQIVKSLDDHPIRGWSVPQISPDGTRVALRADSSICVFDLKRGSRLRLRSGPNLNRPSWTSSGDEVVFVDQQVGFKVQAADNSADAAVWLDSPSAFGPVSFSSDGRYAAHGDFRSDGEGGIWYREAGPDGSWSDPIPWLVTPASENQPQFSPDGRYLAYLSDESRRAEVYVRPFPEGQEQSLVSTNGGRSGRWSADGDELFYLRGKVLLSVPVSTADGFTAGVPRRLFEWPDGAPDSFAVFPDGERFLAIEVDQPAAFGVWIIENWYEEFRDQEK
jgi:serine/threonine-protein kinase